MGWETVSRLTRDIPIKGLLNKEKDQCGTLKKWKELGSAKNCDREANDLEHELWSVLNPKATEEEKNMSSLDLLLKKLESQTDRVNALLSKVATAKAEFGENSSQYTSAYNDLLKEVKTYAENIQELRTVAKSVDSSEINKAVILWSYNNQDTMKIMRENLKMSEEAIREYILGQLGYTSDNVVANKAKKYLSSYESFVTKMTEALSSGNLALMEQIKIGIKGAEDLANSVKEGGEEVKKAGEEVGEGTVAVVEDMGKDMVNAGVELMNSLADGITQEGAVAVNAMKHVGQQMNDAFESATSSISTRSISPVSTSEPIPSIIVSGGTASVSSDKVSKIAGDFGPSKEANTKEMVVSNVVNYNMTQNNTSPKALSNAEIYRETKTLLSTTKATAERVTA